MLGEFVGVDLSQWQAAVGAALESSLGAGGEIATNLGAALGGALGTALDAATW